MSYELGAGDGVLLFGIVRQSLIRSKVRRSYLSKLPPCDPPRAGRPVKNEVLREMIWQKEASLRA
jgi:hypothetical protein